MDGLLTDLEVTVVTYERRSYGSAQYDGQETLTCQKLICFKHSIQHYENGIPTLSTEFLIYLCID